MKWRKWVRLIHRDVGYVCAGLTVVYAVSGVAVNHVRDWNPNYRVTRDTVVLGDLPSAYPGSEGFAAEVLAEVGISDDVLSSFRPDSATVDVFVDGGSVRVDLEARVAVVERVSERRILRATNVLHLNQPRKLWTWVADLFAVALALLAVTGIFILKGKTGITGRGAWLTGLGVAIPVVFIILYL